MYGNAGYWSDHVSGKGVFGISRGQQFVSRLQAVNRLRLTSTLWREVTLVLNAGNITPVNILFS